MIRGVKFVKMCSILLFAFSLLIATNAVPVVIKFMLHNPPKEFDPFAASDDVITKSPNLCPDDSLTCTTTYPMDETAQFMCTGHGQCPKNYICCEHNCYCHKICKSLNSSVESTTVTKSLPIVNTTISYSIKIDKISSTPIEDDDRCGTSTTRMYSSTGKDIISTSPRNNHFDITEKMPTESTKINIKTTTTTDYSTTIKDMYLTLSEEDYSDGADDDKDTISTTQGKNNFSTTEKDHEENENNLKTISTLASFHSTSIKENDSTLGEEHNTSKMNNTIFTTQKIKEFGSTAKVPDESELHIHSTTGNGAADDEDIISTTQRKNHFSTTETDQEVQENNLRTITSVNFHSTTIKGNDSTLSKDDYNGNTSTTNNTIFTTQKIKEFSTTEKVPEQTEHTIYRTTKDGADDDKDTIFTTQRKNHFSTTETDQEVNENIRSTITTLSSFHSTTIKKNDTTLRDDTSTTNNTILTTQKIKEFSTTQKVPEQTERNIHSTTGDGADDDKDTISTTQRKNHFSTTETDQEVNENILSTITTLSRFHSTTIKNNDSNLRDYTSTTNNTILTTQKIKEFSTTQKVPEQTERNIHSTTGDGADDDKDNISTTQRKNNFSTIDKDQEVNENILSTMTTLSSFHSTTIKENNSTISSTANKTFLTTQKIKEFSTTAKLPEQSELNIHSTTVQGEDISFSRDGADNDDTISSTKRKNDFSTTEKDLEVNENNLSTLTTLANFHSTTINVDSNELSSSDDHIIPINDDEVRMGVVNDYSSTIKEEDLSSITEYSSNSKGRSSTTPKIKEFGTTQKIPEQTQSVSGDGLDDDEDRISTTQRINLFSTSAQKAQEPKENNIESTTTVNLSSTSIKEENLSSTISTTHKIKNTAKVSQQTDTLIHSTSIKDLVFSSTDDDEVGISTAQTTNGFSTTNKVPEPTNNLIKSITTVNVVPSTIIQEKEISSSRDNTSNKKETISTTQNIKEFHTTTKAPEDTHHNIHSATIPEQDLFFSEDEDTISTTKNKNQISTTTNVYSSTLNEYISSSGDYSGDRSSDGSGDDEDKTKESRTQRKQTQNSNKEVPEDVTSSDKHSNEDFIILDQYGVQLFDDLKESNNNNNTKA